jgi:hypothetical protein
MPEQCHSGIAIAAAVYCKQCRRSRGPDVDDTPPPQHAAAIGPEDPVQRPVAPVDALGQALALPFEAPIAQ